LHQFESRALELTSGGSDSRLVREPGIAAHSKELCRVMVMSSHKVVSPDRRVIRQP